MTTRFQGFVQLERCDEQVDSNKRVDPVFLNNTTGIDINNQIPEVKQNNRLTRKRTFQNKSITEDSDRRDEVKKKKKLMVKIVPQKVTKKLQYPISFPVNITENVPTNSDFNKISETISSSIHINNELTNFEQSSLKTAQNLRKNYITSNEKNVLVNNVNEDDKTSNKHGKNEKLLPIKTSINKRKKSITYEKNFLVNNVTCGDTLSNEQKKNEKLLSIKTASYKRKKSTISHENNVLVNNVNVDEHKVNEKLLGLEVPKCKIISSKKNSLVNNINKDDISNEHGENKKLVLSLIPESKTPKRRSYTKKRTVSKVDNDNIPNEFVINDNSLSLESPKHTLFKSDITATKNVVVNNTNKSDEIINFEENDNMPQTKSCRNKSNKLFVKKKHVINNVKKINVHNEVGDRSDIVPQKRSFSSSKKRKLPSTDVGNMYNNKVDLKQTLSIGKPPKIKKKWSDEWSGDKLLSNIFKSDNCNNCDNLRSPKKNLNNYTKGIKKVLKISKSKNTKHNFAKTKILENLSKNTNNSFLIKSPNSSIHTDTSTIDILGTQDPNDLFSTNNLCTYSRNNKHGVTEPILRQYIADKPFLCEETKSIQTNSSKVSKKLTTSTQSIGLPTISFPSTSTSIPSTSTSIPSTSTSIPSTSTSIPSTSTALHSTSTELPSTAPSLPTTYTGLPTMSTELPTKSLSISTVSNNVLSCENDQQPPDPIFSSNYSFPMGSENTEISYGITILSEAISRQSKEAIEEKDKIKSSEQDLNEIKSCLKKANGCFRSRVPMNTTATKSCQEITERQSTPKIFRKNSRLYNVLFGNDDDQSCSERQLHIISKCYNIPIEDLRKTVIDEPLAILNELYCNKIIPNMLTVTPIVKDEKNSPLNENFNFKYKLNPIRETAAYEKTNLKDLMVELSNTLPSWSLSIVPNPPRYVITNMSIDKNGVPIANKVIVLDKSFIASVYINQCLIHRYCKRYTTAAEIVNLIKKLNSE